MFALSINPYATIFKEFVVLHIMGRTYRDKKTIITVKSIKYAPSLKNIMNVVRF